MCVCVCVCVCLRLKKCRLTVLLANVGGRTRQSGLILAGTQDMEACMRVSKAVEHVLGVNEDPRTQAQHLQV